MKRAEYFSVQSAGRGADIYIFGDITSQKWNESDVSSYGLAQTVAGLDVDTITVHINSYGGEVAEGMAIYNSLRNSPAKIQTVCDGFACSAASLIFMAGDERLMNPTSLLMIHNAWSAAEGNAADLRKAAEDLETISEAAATAYQSRVNLTDDALRELLDKETWITPEAAMNWGFATGILEEERPTGIRQSARAEVYRVLLADLTHGAPPAPEPHAGNQAMAFFANIL